MLQSILIERFKSLNHVQLELGKLNIFIGANASGKSNFFDALRVLQGLNYGFTTNEVFDGKPKSSTSDVWPGIRGGSRGALSKSVVLDSNRLVPAIRFVSRRRVREHDYKHEIVFRSSLLDILLEEFSADAKLRYKVYDPDPLVSHAIDIYTSTGQYVGTGKASDRSKLYFEEFIRRLAPEEPVPSRIDPTYLIDASDMQFLDVQAEVLRQYSQNQNVKRIGDRGEDFAALVSNLISGPGTKEAYLSWLRELVPSDIDDVVILRGALDEPLFAIRSGANEFAAPLLSDGTLRFAALTAALFQPDAPSALLIEEIENGIHPTRLRLLVELLRSRAEKGTAQLFVTTHSPTVMAWLKPEEYAHTYLCVRAEDGSSVIKPVSSLPHFIEAVQRTPFADLFAEGWLETTL
jgi:predicted ATPase